MLLPKYAISARMDRIVLGFLQSQGRGYQVHISEVLLG